MNAFFVLLRTVTTHPSRSRKIRSVAWCLFVAITIAYPPSESVVRADESIAASKQAEAEHFFESKVRPLLLAKCVSCHGPKKQHAGLRLDSRQGILSGGDSGAAVVPFQPDESLLMEAVRRESLEMPPDETLHADQVTLLSRWIIEGTVWPNDGSDMVTPAAPDYQNHWAFRPIQRPEIPLVSDSQWPHNEIDFFVLHRLEREGFTPSPPASLDVLTRRIKYDLVGLPVTFDEIASLPKEQRSMVISDWIDEQLDSPHYGERAARYWLDVARYADTKGYVFFEKPEFRMAYSYRDYVIDSFNDDKPFHEFVREQLAADLIEGIPHESLAALGFVTVGDRFKNDIHEIIADRIDTVSRGLMGITISCARCHDHKYDPISIEDYYSLYGVFQNSVEPLQLPFRAGDDVSLKDPQALEIRQAAVNLENHYREKYEKLLAEGRERLAEYLALAQSQRGGVDAAAFDTITEGDDLNPELLLIWQQYLEDSERDNDPVFLPWHRRTVSHRYV